MAFAIEDMRKADWGRVKAIYHEGLATGLAAFMSEPPTWQIWHDGHLAVGRLVARTTDGALAGWSALARIPDT